MAKSCTYKVRCTTAIAEEMARYEGGEVVEKADRIAPEWPDEILDLSTYLFTITTPYYKEPNRARWASFGVYEFEIL